MAQMNPYSSEQLESMRKELFSYVNNRLEELKHRVANLRIEDFLKAIPDTYVKEISNGMSEEETFDQFRMDLEHSGRLSLGDELRKGKYRSHMDALRYGNETQVMWDSHKRKALDELIPVAQLYASPEYSQFDETIKEGIEGGLNAFVNALAVDRYDTRKEEEVQKDEIRDIIRRSPIFRDIIEAIFGMDAQEFITGREVRKNLSEWLKEYLRTNPPQDTPEYKNTLMDYANRALKLGGSYKEGDEFRLGREVSADTTKLGYSVSEGPRSLKDKMYDGFSKTEVRILKDRLGLRTGKTISLEELAQELEIPETELEQIEMELLERIRKSFDKL